MLLGFDMWECFLPEQWAAFAEELDPSRVSGTERADRRKRMVKWTALPEEFLPRFISDLRDRFWRMLREGEDTTDIDKLADGDERVLQGVLKDPAILVEMTGQRLSGSEQLEDYFRKVLNTSAEILSAPLMSHGEWNKEILQAKAKLASNFQGQVNALMKLNSLPSGVERKYPPLLIGKKRRRKGNRALTIETKARHIENASPPDDDDAPWTEGDEKDI